MMQVTHEDAQAIATILFWVAGFAAAAIVVMVVAFIDFIRFTKGR